MKNRKNKLTNLFKIGVFLFGISILLWNCQQEEINYSENVITKKKLEYSVQKIHYYDLVNDVEFQKSLKIVKNKFANNKEQQNTYNRNTTQINNDLVILTEEVNRVDTNDGIITWTFETEAPAFEGSDFENFVVKKQNDEFYYYLISYKYNTDILADEYETIESYRVREEYLTLDNLNLSSRNSDAFDWVYPDSGGGGGSNCAEIYTEIEPCSSGGYHTLKYACQHYGGSHGVSNSPPCDDVCSGTTVVTVLDYSNCGNVTYDSPSGPTGDPNDGQIDGGGYGVPTGGGGYGVPTGGGGLPSVDSNANPVGNIPVGPTVSAPISYSDGTIADTTLIVANQINEAVNFTLTQTELRWLSENETEANAINNLSITENSNFINSVIDILSETANPNILLTPSNNQSFLNLIGDILNTENNSIFKNFNTIFNNLNEYNNLTLSEWQLLSTKANEIYSITGYYNIPSLSDLNQLSPQHQQVVVENTFFIGIFPSLKSMGINLPNTAEEWKVFFEIMKPILLEIGIEFIPFGGIYNSAIDTLDGINAGDWTAITLGVVGIIVEFTPFDQIKNLFQLIRYSKKGIKIFKLTRKFTNEIRNALEAGVKITLEGSAVIFKKGGAEIARIVNNIMTFKYAGFGGDIITNPNKTTTILGKYEDIVGNGTKNIIDSRLSKSGINKGGINALSETPNPNWNDQQIWDNINEPWLRDAANRNDVIRVVSDPNNPSNIYKDNGQLSFFGREHQLLTKPTSQGGLGYTYNSSTFTYTR